MEILNFPRGKPWYYNAVLGIYFGNISIMVGLIAFKGPMYTNLSEMMLQSNKDPPYYLPVLGVIPILMFTIIKFTTVYCTKV